MLLRIKHKFNIMKKIFTVFLILLILIPAVQAGNITIRGVDFEIPEEYEHGTLKDTYYVYKSGLVFRILNVDDSKNLRINFGDDLNNAKSVDQTTIAGHDAVVISKEYNSKPYTTVYFVTGEKIFLICFNDTYVNDDITNIISKTPEQTMSHDEFSNKLNQASDDYQNQLANEEADYRQQEYYKNNKPTNRFFFFRF